MIKVRRGPIPGTLARNGSRWKMQLLATADPKKAEVRTRYSSPEIKAALLQTFMSKCAYCESKIRQIDYGQIDHFRPFLLFPDLTYEWSNLFLACGVCNGAQFKGARFPEEAEGGPLVNPCEEDPAAHLDFVFDTTTKLASIYGKTDRGKTTVSVFGLNRHELREYRSKFVQRLRALSRLATQDEEAAELIQEVRAVSSEYSAFLDRILAVDGEG